MKILDPDMYRRARVGILTVDEVKETLAISRWSEDTNSPSQWIIDWWIYCLAKKESEYPDLDWQGFRQSLARYSMRDRNNIVSVMAGHIDRLQLPKPQ